MGKRFNLAEYSNLVTVSEMDRPEIVMIPWDKIHPNKENFYQVGNVTDLVNAIQMQGLLSPVVVTPDRTGDGYLLIAGHRRHKAWGQLRDEDPAKYAAIPAIVRSFGSESEARLALILSNSAARVLTPYEIDQQAQATERVFYELKEQGFEFPGRMRDHVAKAVKQSATKLARLRAIRKRLAECWRPAWKGGTLTEAVAYELSQCPAELQEMIFRADPKTTAYPIPAVRRLYEQGVRWTGPEGKKAGCDSCRRSEAFLHHDLDSPNFPCKGKTCCLQCEYATRSYDPCPRMCSKAREARSERLKNKKEAEEEARQQKEDRILAEIRKSAARLVKAADAAGGVDEKAPMRTRYGATTVEELRKIAAGSKKPSFFYCNELSADEGFNVKSAAQVLGCSADYVCGLTEELHPAAVSNMDTAPEWRTGTPERDGRYLVKIADGGGARGEFTARWTGDLWSVFDRPLFEGMTVTQWWPLPKEGE